MPKERHPDIFMPWFIMDYQKDTMHLTLEEDGLYRRMLDMHWLTKGKGLPDDDLRLANTLRVDMATWLRLKPMMAPFFQIANGVWLNRRNYAEYLGRLEAMESASGKAQKANAARWHSTRNPQGLLEDVPEESQSESKSQSQSNPIPKAKGKAVINRLRTALETELMDRTQAVVGAEDMKTHGGLWRTLMRKDVTTYKKVLVEIESMTKEQHLPERQFKKSPGACFIDLYKRWTNAN